MEILKYGNIKDEKWIGKCHICGTIAQCDRNEITDFQHGDIKYKNDDFSWGNCPFCSNEGKMVFYRIISDSGKKILNEVEQYNKDNFDNYL